MSQCVPSWDLDENYPNNCRAPLRSRSNSTAPDVPMLELDYEVAELTWENGQLAMHGLGPPRVQAKAAANNPSPTKNTCTGTLESIVNQATSLPQAQRNGKPPLLDEFATAPCWFHQQRPSMTTMDALVPCSNRRSEDRATQVMDPAPRVGGTRSTRVGSCSGPVPLPVPDSTKDDDVLNGKRARVARVPVAPEWSSRDQSFSGSATFGRESQRVSVTHDTYDMDMDMGVGFTGTSMGSPENTSSAKQGNKATTTDDHDSVCHSRPLREAGDEEYKKKGNGKSSVSTKRSRAAAIHNQSERKRRDKINQRMKTLQKLVPNSSKTDKASMLDEVIEYLKQLQAQVQVMSRMNMPPMMLPMAMQQQLQMSMLSSMGMGMGMGMGVMDMNSMSRPNIPGMPPLLHPFLPLASWDGLGDRLQASPMTDPLSTFLACQPQAASMDAYNRMAAMYQQMQQQPPASSSKS